MQANHIKPLTGIRFFAAAWVVLHHFHPWIIMLCPLLNVGDSFMKLGYEAVPFFFILSGFILSHNYFPEYSLSKHPKFIFLRFARLWPVHLATLALLILGPDLLKINANTLKSIVEELLMVRSWFDSAPEWNAPAWSISAEWFAYIFAFPLAYLLFRRIRFVPILAAIVVLFLVAQVSPINRMIFPAWSRCGAIFFLFLAGCGLYQIRRLTREMPATLLTNAGAILVVVYTVFNTYLSEFVLYLAFAMMILGLSYERGWLAKILSTRWVVYGGLASYSLYMTHYVVIQTYIYYSWSSWKKLHSSPVIGVGMLLIMAMVFLGTAVVFYRYIEEPMNKRLRNLISNKRPVVSSTDKALNPDAQKV